MNLDPEPAEGSGSWPGVVSPAAGRVPGGERGDVCARFSRLNTRNYTSCRRWSTETSPWEAEPRRRSEGAAGHERSQAEEAGRWLVGERSEC